MADKPKLSVCIPTYNRAEYLDGTINSIVSQLDDSNRDLVEISVSDNASSDNTDDVIAKYKDKVKLVYHKNPQNMGPDRNYLKCVEIATGEFCLFFGSDDILAEGAIKYILSKLESNYEIYLTDRFDCNIEMKNPKECHYTNYPRTKKLFDFKKEDDLVEYFSSVNNLGGVFSYLSSIIFKKACWDAVQYDERYTGTAYSHVYILLSFMKQEQCKLCYLDKTLPYLRLENDSFLEGKNLIKRCNIDYNGYKMLAEDLFSEMPKVKEAFMGILTREHPYKFVLSSIAMTTGTTKEEWENYRNSINIYAYSKLQKFLVNHFNLWGRFYYIFLYFYKLAVGKKPPKMSNIFRKNICFENK